MSTTSFSIKRCPLRPFRLLNMGDGFIVLTPADGTGIMEQIFTSKFRTADEAIKATELRMKMYHRGFMKLFDNPAIAQ